MEFSRQIADAGLYSTAKRLDFYCEQQLFKSVDLRGKRLLDIGGGIGLFAAYAIAEGGATEALVLEPEVEGSSAGMIDGFSRLRKALGNPAGLDLLPIPFEELPADRGLYDVVLLHNSINHVQEDLVQKLPEDADALEWYGNFFALLKSRMAPGGTLIVADCSSRNFFADVRLHNPFAPTIEWEKHQTPEIWASLLGKYGFVPVREDWTSLNTLGKFGRLVTGNRIVSYLTFSHFIIELRLAGDGGPIETPPSRE